MRVAKGGDKDAIAQKNLLERLVPHFEAGHTARMLKLDEEERRLARTFHLLTIKPTMYIANVAEDGFDNNPHLDAVRKIAEAEGQRWWPCATRLKRKLPSSIPPTSWSSCKTWA